MSKFTKSPRRSNPHSGYSSALKSFTFVTFENNGVFSIKELNHDYLVELPTAKSRDELVAIFQEFTPLYIALLPHHKAFFENSVVLFFIFAMDNQVEFLSFDWQGDSLPNWTKPALAMWGSDESPTLH